MKVTQLSHFQVHLQIAKHPLCVIKVQPIAKGWIPCIQYTIFRLANTAPAPYKTYTVPVCLFTCVVGVSDIVFHIRACVRKV